VRIQKKLSAAGGFAADSVTMALPVKPTRLGALPPDLRYTFTLHGHCVAAKLSPWTH